MIIAFILLIAVCQLLNARSLRRLSVEEKAAVVDAAAGRGAWPLLGVVVIYGITSIVSLRLGHRPWLTPVFMLTLLILLAGFYIWEFRRLSHAHLPTAYLRNTGLTYMLLFCGLVALFAEQIYHDWVRHQL